VSGELQAKAIPSGGLVLWAEGIEDTSNPPAKKFVGTSSFAVSFKGTEDVADVVHATIRPNIFLTFDDGPTPTCEPVVRELNAAGLCATFFINMQHMENKPEEQLRILKLILDSKHILASHGYSHKIYTESHYNAEIKNAEAETRKARELDPQSPKKDPAGGVVKDFALNGEKAKAVLGSTFPGFEIARLPGAGSQSKFKESDGTPVDFAKSLATQLRLCHATWDFEFWPNGAFGNADKWTKEDWHGVAGVSAETSSDRLPARNDIIVLLHDGHWAGKTDRLRALFTVLRNEANVIPLLPPPENHRSIKYPPPIVA
jgi:peptidoglycan/xylan/chitin deacetylase (PgdA/CDA1 family)